MSGSGADGGARGRGAHASRQVERFCDELLAGLLELAGILELAEVARQQRRGTGRSLVTPSSDRDPGSVRLLALTWWPAGLTALEAAAGLPRFGASQRSTRPCLLAGVASAGVALRQWATATLGEYFVGHVLAQPGQTDVSSGPYRCLAIPPTPASGWK